MVRGTTRLLVVAGCLVSTSSAGLASAQSSCPSWAGEFDPLPRTSDENPVRARWARLRADELTAIARPIESVARVDAHRLWVHVLCLDPDAAEAHSALARTVPVRVHRPSIVTGADASEPVRSTAELAFERLAAPIHLRAAPVPPRIEPAAPPPADFSAVDRALSEADARMREARFEEALAAAQRALGAFEGSASGEPARSRRARAESAVAVAQVALGREAEARASFARALAADPSFRLDVKTTSPRVMRAFDAARAGGSPR